MMACRIPLRPLFVLVLLGWGLPALPAAASDCEKCFAVFIMPDTQNYVKGLNSQSFPGDCSLGDIYPGGFPSGVDAKTRKACHWRSVMNWICANGGGWTEPDTGHTMDIKLVMHLGDVVANNTPNQQWPFVDRAFDILDDTVTPANELLGDAACTEPMPHVAIPGNHDLDGNWVADNYPLNLFGTGGCDNSSGSGKKHRLCNTNKYQSVLGKTDNTCADSGTWLRNAQQLGACEDPLDCQEDEWFIGAGPCVADNERTDDWDGYLGDGPAGDQLGRSRAALIRAPNGRPFLFLGVEENFRPNINNFAAWVAGSTNDHLPTAAEQWPFQVLRSYAGVPTIMFSHDGLVAGLQNNFPTFTHAFPQVIATVWGHVSTGNTTVNPVVVASSHAQDIDDYESREHKVLKINRDYQHQSLFGHDANNGYGYGYGYNDILVIDPDIVDPSSQQRGQLRLHRIRIPEGFLAELGVDDVTYNENVPNGAFQQAHFVHALDLPDVIPGWNAVVDANDNCPDDRFDNPTQADVDEDGFGDVCDNCIDAANLDQTDADSDDFGDACDFDCSGPGGVLDDFHDSYDFDELMSQFGNDCDWDPSLDCSCDFNGDNAVGIPDFTLLMSRFDIASGPSGFHP